MRAARAGMRHVIAADVFVRHVGEVSFAGSGADRRARAQAMVDALYPEFQAGLREFLAADPVLPLRRRADLERLRRAHDARALRLEPAGHDHARLWWDRPGEEFSLWFHRSQWDALAGLLRHVAIPGGGPIPELDPGWLAAPREESAPSAEEGDRLRLRVAELERSLATIESSRSWKLTAPLRSAARRLRGLLS
jgi:hypothetical protein